MEKTHAVHLIINGKYAAYGIIPARYSRASANDEVLKWIATVPGIDLSLPRADSLSSISVIKETEHGHRSVHIEHLRGNIKPQITQVRAIGESVLSRAQEAETHARNKCGCEIVSKDGVIGLCETCNTVYKTWPQDVGNKPHWRRFGDVTSKEALFKQMGYVEKVEYENYETFLLFVSGKYFATGQSGVTGDAEEDKKILIERLQSVEGYPTASVNVVIVKVSNDFGGDVTYYNATGDKIELFEETISDYREQALKASAKLQRFECVCGEALPYDEETEPDVLCGFCGACYKIYSEPEDPSKSRLRLNGYKNLMMPRKHWQEFFDSGILFYINTILHFIGWVIVMQMDEGGKTVIGAYPARTKYRGFDHKTAGEGHIKIAKYLKETSAELYEEAKN